MIEIKIRTFAMLREIIGKKTIGFSSGSKLLEDILQQLIDTYPDLALHLKEGKTWNSDFVYAVNKERISHEAINEMELQQGDELAIIPPAGGGLEN